MEVSLENWPIETKSGRYICSPDRPMPMQHKKLLWAHTNVKTDPEYDSDYNEKYLCQDCGHTWKEELPE